jgi:hypothetical protein
VNPFDAFFPGAKCAAEEHAMLILRSMPKNPAAAVVARRRQRVNRTLEAVEGVGRAAQRYLKGLVVVVTTNFTGFHRMLHKLSEMCCERGWRMVRAGNFGLDLIHRVLVCRPLGPYASYRFTPSVCLRKGPSVALRSP